MWMEYRKTTLRFDIYVLCYSNLLPMMFLPHDYFSGMNKMDRVLSQTRWARLFEGGGIWTLKDNLSKSLSFLFLFFCARILFTGLCSFVMEELERILGIYSFIHCLEQHLAHSYSINTYFSEPILGPGNAKVIQTLSLWAQNRALCTRIFC